MCTGVLSDNVGAVMGTGVLSDNVGAVMCTGVPGADVQVAVGHSQSQPVYRRTQADGTSRCCIRSR